MTTTSTVRSAIGTMPGSTTHWCTATACIPTPVPKGTTRTWSVCSSTSSYEARDEKIQPHIQLTGRRRCRGCVTADGGERAGGRAAGRAALCGPAVYRAGPRRCSGRRQKGDLVLYLPWGGWSIRGPHLSASGGATGRIFVSPARFLQAG